MIGLRSTSLLEPASKGATDVDTLRLEPRCRRPCNFNDFMIASEPGADAT